MKKPIFAAAFAVLALAACQKIRESETVQEAIEVNGIEVKLIATIGTGAKVTYTDDTNSLKAAWEAGDKVSVISLDSGGGVLHNDIFTADAAGKSSTFSGTFTGAADAAAVVVYYPAFTEGTLETGMSTVADDAGYPYLGNLQSGSSKFGIMNVSGYYHAYATPVAMDQTPGHVWKYTIMRGAADLAGLKEATPVMTVSLEHLSGVFKISLNLPVAGMTVNRISLNFGSNSCFYAGNTFSVNPGTPLSSGFYYSSTSASMRCGALSAHQGTGITFAGTAGTLYFPIPVNPNRRFSNLESVTITCGSDTYTVPTGYTGETEFSPGKMYRMNVTLPKVVMQHSFDKDNFSTTGTEGIWWGPYDDICLKPLSLDGVDRTWTYESSDTEAATVSSDGVVSLKGASVSPNSANHYSVVWADATITATSGDGRVLSTRVVGSVYYQAFVGWWEYLPYTKKLSVGATSPLNMNYQTGTGGTRTLTTTEHSGFTLYSSDPSVATWTVTDEWQSAITAVAAGTATLSIGIPDDSGIVITVANVTVE
ncbi:MAG: hypothetical protein IJS62_08150 [Bacteroidales bacterium]|nr:hypothetical protein [Bacteroidales bacterium]